MIILTDEEVEALTGKKRKPSQSRALSFMGIEHKMRPDGSLVVLRTMVEKILGDVVMTKTRKKSAPDFSMVR